MKRLLLVLVSLLTFISNYAQSWSGTGFALKDKYVITNYHVVKDAVTIKISGIVGNHKKEYSAVVEAKDDYHDLALLRIKDDEFQGFGSVPYFTRMQMAEVGESVFVLGYPLTSTMGEEIKLTTGVISSRTGFQGAISLYQISAPIQPGNSGAPLFDNEGNLIGVVNAKHNGAENVGYAIKSFYVNMLVESIVSSDILPQNSSIKHLPLTEKVKKLKDYVFIIKCSAERDKIKNDSSTNDDGCQYKPKSRDSLNCIFYTSANGKVIKPTTDIFGSKILSNIYENGQGIIEFDRPVTMIGENCFNHCIYLTSVSIPSGVKKIGNDAFSNCESLESITISEGVASIGYGAFEGCSSLTSVTIPASVTSIGREAFDGCTGELIINSKIVETNYDYDNRPSYDGWLKGANFTKFTIGDSVTSIGSYAFDGCSSLAGVTIGDSVTEIGNWTFSSCSSLTSITIPDSVTVIGSCAFDGCSSLTSVTIGDSVTSIGYGAFSSCSSLTSITIPDSVTEIGNYAFSGCTSLTSVTIGDSVTKIGEYAFCECSSLTSVYCKPTTPPTGGEDMFKYYRNGQRLIGCKIYVPRNSVKAYKSAKYWKKYASDIVGYDF